MTATPARRLADRLRPHIADERVLVAIGVVPRERFVPVWLRSRAYANTALPIDREQSISQPLVVARMLELLELRGDELALDVGTGSGYHAALLATLCREVVSIERHRELSEGAARALREAGITNVELVVGDGWQGVPQRAPYDAINVAAGVVGAVPGALVAQLAPGGRLVAPVASDPASAEDQRLAVIHRDGGGALSQQLLEPVRFVPLVPGSPD